MTGLELDLYSNFQTKMMVCIRISQLGFVFYFYLCVQLFCVPHACLVSVPLNWSYNCEYLWVLGMEPQASRLASALNGV